MAGEKTGTSTKGTSNPGTDFPGTGSRGYEYPELSIPSENPVLTRTSMTTDELPLGTRPKQPHPTRIKKEIDVFLLAGSLLDPVRVLEGANQIWGQCFIFFKGFFHPPYDEKATRRLIGADPGNSGKPVDKLSVIINADQLSAGQKNLRAEWHKRRKRPMAIFFLPNVHGRAGAKSSIDSESTEPIVYLGIPEVSSERDLAHEFGHFLLSPDHQYDSPLMHPFMFSNEMVDIECRAARGDSKARQAVFQHMQQKRF